MKKASVSKRLPPALIRALQMCEEIFGAASEAKSQLAKSDSKVQQGKKPSPPAEEQLDLFGFRKGY
jgi:hypothetical protein